MPDNQPSSATRGNEQVSRNSSVDPTASEPITPVQRVALPLVFSIVAIALVGALKYPDAEPLLQLGSYWPAVVWASVALLPLMLLPPRLLARSHPLATKRRVQILNNNIYHLETVGRLKTEDKEAEPILDHRTAYLLAAVDKFVDEAHEVLTDRAAAYFLFASSFLIATVGTLHLAGIFAHETFLTATNDLARIGVEYKIEFTTLRIFSSLAVAAAVYAIVKTFLSFSSSFFHEATRLLDRRHALRFGRLYMYLQRSQYSFEHVEKTFEWHRDAQTVFQGISATKIADSTLNQVLAMVTETAKALVDTAAKMKKGA